MTRKSSVLILVAALTGATMTVFLLVQSQGGGNLAGRAREDGGSGVRGPGPAGAQGERNSGPAAARTGAQGGTDSRFPGAGPAGGRQPFDTQKSLADIAQDQRRVFELLDAIQGVDPKDPATRVAHYRELQGLMQSLGGSIDPAVRDRLIVLLQEVEDKWRALVGDTLGSLQGDEVAARTLLDLLKSKPENVYTRNAIYLALGKLNVTSIVPDLLGMIGTGYEGETLIVRTVGQIGGPEAFEALVQRLSKPILPETQREIERVLGEKRDATVLARLRDGLDDADGRTRTAYLNILSMTRDPQYSAAVLHVFDTESDPAVRKAAIRALGMFGDAASGQKLIELLQGGREDERADAVRAVHYITSAETVDTLAKDWRTLNNDARIAVMGAAARLQRPTEQLFTIATDTLRDPSERLHNFAAQVLGQPGRDASVEPLVAFLARSENARERSAAISALQKVGTLAAADEALRVIERFADPRMRDTYRSTFEKIRDRHLQLQQGK